MRGCGPTISKFSPDLSRSEILLHSHELALQLGMPEEDVQVAIRRAGPDGRSQRDALWNLYTDAFLRAYDENAAAQALYSLALLLDDDGRDPRMLLRLAARTAVAAKIAASPQRPLRFRLHASNSACIACDRAGGTLVSEADAQQALLVPNPHCTRRINGDVAFCRCRYIAVAEPMTLPKSRRAAKPPGRPVIGGAIHKPGRTRASLLTDVQSG